MQFFRFSTGNLDRTLDSAARARAWAASLEAAGATGRCEAVVEGQSEFHSDITGIAMDGFAATMTRGSPIRLLRTRRLLRERPTDDFHLLISTAPTPIIVEQFGRPVELSPGEGALMASSDLHMSGAPLGGSVCSLALPRAALAQACPNPEDLAARRVAAGNPALSLLRDYLRPLFADPLRVDDQLGLHVRQHLFDLATTAAVTLDRADGQATGSGARAAQRARIRHLIDRYHADPAFDIDVAAMRLGLSRRTIQLVLAEGEETFSASLLQARLAAVHAALADPGRRGHSIAEIAFACGFSDISTFNRSFRRGYAATPSAVRRRQEQKSRSCPGDC